MSCHEPIRTGGTGRHGERIAAGREPRALNARPRRYSRWRAACLIGVYVLMAAHVVHWKLAGRTLAPLELNEVLYTLELGIVTAGFIFMSLAVLSVMIFGRFFCSWGCHILALEDLCSWLLEKIGVRPKPVRSRVLLVVPVGAMFYMFIWPHVVRIVEKRSAPQLHVRSDAEGWASFVTDDFWRNLPGPWITILTFAVCGFVIVYFMGTRSFCTYACPYGVIFSLADRIAPGKIMASGDRANCAECGLCTAACESHIRVHEELTVFGKVVNPSCLKDLDCVSVCPNGSIKYGFTVPSFFKSWRRLGRFGVPFDFSIPEDALIGAVFVASLLVFRGLYDVVPFLMTLGLGAILAYGAVLMVRLCQRRDLRLNNFQLKRSGRMTMAGWGFALLAALTMAFAAHSAVIRYHEFTGARLFNVLANEGGRTANPDATQVGAALSHLGFCEQWGLVRPGQLDHRLASLHLMTESPQEAEPYLRRLVQRMPEAVQLRLTLAAVLLTRGEADEAISHLQAITQSPVIAAIGADAVHAGRLRAAAYEMLGDIDAATGKLAAAAQEYRNALASNPESEHARVALAKLQHTGSGMPASE